MSHRLFYLVDTLQRSGSTNQLAQLAGALSRDEFDVHVCALAAGGAVESELAAAEVPTTILGRRFAADPLTLVRLKRLMRQLQPGMVHTWGFDAGVYGRLAGRNEKVRHSVASQLRPEPAQPMWQAWVERRLAERTDRFVASNPAIRDECVGRGLPGERFTVIPCGVPAARESDVSREELLRELDVPADARLIGVIGRLVLVKRVKDLVWAADLIRVLHDNMRLLVIGEGPLLPELERFARLASDLDHIRFLGRRDDLWRIVPHLDVLWNGSSAEGHSSAVMEAMAAGVPVVATDIPGNRELVVDGETGYLVPIDGRAARARATHLILSDAELAKRLGAAGRTRMAEHFPVEAMVARHAELYREILPGS